MGSDRGLDRRYQTVGDRFKGAATNAYFTAGDNYSKRLNAYQQAMTQLSTQTSTNCPPKTAMPASPTKTTRPSSVPATSTTASGAGVHDLGPVPVNCTPSYYFPGANCVETTTPAGTFKLSSHIARDGETVTGTVSPTSQCGDPYYVE